MVIKAWSRSLTPEKAEALGVEFCASPHAAAQGADALTVHLALTDATKHIVNDDILNAVNPGAYIINTSRGEMVDEAALIRAMDERGLRAGLDVFDNEPGASDPKFESEITKQPNMYGTHHIGASTDEASEAVGDEVVRIVRIFGNEGWVPNCVNIAESTPATHALIVRHADKVGVLANLLGQLKEEGINVQQMENIIFKGAAACARIQIADAPSLTALSAIDANPDVFNTSLVELEEIMTRAHNFSAGPAALPLPVLESLQGVLTEFEDAQAGLMEISHRSKQFDAVVKSAEALARDSGYPPSGLFRTLLTRRRKSSVLHERAEPLRPGR